jgi:hypothetical protein
VIRALLSLLSLLSRTPALNLTPSAFARRRLEKSSIYLFRKWPAAMVPAGSVASARAPDNSDNSANRSARTRQTNDRGLGGGKSVRSHGVGNPA